MLTQQFPLQTLLLLLYTLSLCHYTLGVGCGNKCLRGYTVITSYELYKGKKITENSEADRIEVLHQSYNKRMRQEIAKAVEDSNNLLKLKLSRLRGQ